MLNVTEAEGRLRIDVRVQPRASRDQVMGIEEGCLKIKLMAPPVEGEANHALISFLSKTLDIRKKDIEILRGDTARRKLVELRGITRSELESRLSGLTGKT